MKTITLAIALVALIALVGCGGGPMSPSATATPTPSTAMVSINFDDGFESAYVNGIPLFDQAGMKTTQFIITTASVTGSWGATYMTKDQVLDLEKRGHEIAAHTRTHPHLSTLSDTDQYEEINGSKQDLEALLGHPVANFAYPLGDHNDESLTLVQQVGYTSGRSVDGTQKNTAQTNPFYLYAVPVTDSTNIDGVLTRIDQAVTNGTWLILVFHRVDEDGNQISVRHEKIQQIIQYLQQKNVKVVTTSQALQKYGMK